MQRLKDQLQRRYQTKLNKVAKKVRDTTFLQVGSRVQYAPQPRPVVVCPHCEVTSETIGEADTLERLRNKVGVVWVIEDAKDAEKDTRCTSCHKKFPRPAHFAELGVSVLFKSIVMSEPPGVYAFPEECTIISKQEWDKGW